MTENRYVYPVAETMCLKTPRHRTLSNKGIFLSKRINP